MIRKSMRSTRLLSWRYVRWAIAIPTLPVVWWACTSHPLTQPLPQPEQQTDIYISVSPQRLLDLVVMVDNSPSMAPKVDKMNAQFKNLIGALKDPNDQTLPDLRVAVIDSDLGTNCAYQSGSCGPTASGGCFGDAGMFQMLNSPTGCQFNSGSQFLEVNKNKAVNFTGPVDNVNNVFACLATNLGTMGCGEEHQLQAFEWALYLGIDDAHTKQRKDFLRSNAYLGLVFLTDEDDCSAATNDAMFGDNNSNAKLDDLRNESASLRCATRGHQCGGKNLSDASPPGYPTNAAYTHAFNDCVARTDSCSNQTDGKESTDTSKNTSCTPLKSVKNLAAEMKSLKSDPENQILVAGIFGWPLTDADLKNAQYKIDKVPNPNAQDTSHPQVYDYWPICYDPDHQPTKKDPTTGFDSEAAGWGATGGLRNAAFVDEFGANGLKYSICERDFSKAMSGIGAAIAKKLQNLCVEYKLLDTDINTDGLQPSCRVVWRRPDSTSPTGYTEDSNSMPQCDPGATQGNVQEDCWMLVHNTDKCPTTGQLIQVLRTAQEIKDNPTIPAGTKVGMQCRTCTDFTPAICAVAADSFACKACNY